MGSNLVDEIDCASFFDQIDDLIDFPPFENVVGIGGELITSGECSDFPAMWDDGALPDSDHIFSNNFASNLSHAYEETAQLEWLPTFAKGPFSDVGLNPNNKEGIVAHPFPDKKDHDSFRTSSPISVLDSNIPRSKRSRPLAFNPRPATIRPVGTPEDLSGSSSSDSSGTTKNVPKLIGHEQKKKKRDEPPRATNVRKCMHCEITKTPQWRAGPMGQKTLCNACGVRFKSGRLFPEYRPAASPTFVPAVHSNSHKKVLEMRSKAGPRGGVEPKGLVMMNNV